MRTMSPAFRFVIAAAGWSCLWAAENGQHAALTYSAASVVNAATNQPGVLSPNCFVTIYGTGLALTTRAIAQEDIHGGILPDVLPGTGLRVLINNIPASIYYVSPGQVNALVPSILLPGPASLQLVLNALAGPAVNITLTASAPGLFSADGQTAIALHGNGPLVTASAPAGPGEVVVVFATGLGVIVPPAPYAQIIPGAAPLRDVSSFQVLLDGKPVDPKRIQYAGAAPGFAGLFQINVQLPDDLGANPEIKVGTPDLLSPAGIRLPAAAAPVTGSSKIPF